MDLGSWVRHGPSIHQRVQPMISGWNSLKKCAPGFQATVLTRRFMKIVSDTAILHLFLSSIFRCKFWVIYISLGYDNSFLKVVVADDRRTSCQASVISMVSFQDFGLHGNSQGKGWQDSYRLSIRSPNLRGFQFWCASFLNVVFWSISNPVSGSW